MTRVMQDIIELDCRYELDSAPCTLLAEARTIGTRLSSMLGAHCTETNGDHIAGRIPGASQAREI